jgi:Na+/H+ antiporter NhaC
MRNAHKRAESGITIPPGAVHNEVSGDEIAANAKKNPRLINFILPVVALIGATWYFGINALKGVCVALALTVVMLAAQKIMTAPQIFDTAVNGFKTMILPLGIVAASFVLKEANEGLGLTNFVIDTVKPLMNAKLLPVISFLSLSLLTFTTGSFWGVYAIAIPIVIPLAQAMHANQSLTIAAVVSSGAFGSHACFFGDATVLTATGSGCTPLEHALTQLPYALLAATMAALLFLIAGFIY